VSRTASLSGAVPAPAGPNPIALRLGYLGLLPFVLGAALVWLVLPQAGAYVPHILSSYAAVTLALLGGIHWGLGMRQTLPSPVRFAWGVVPPLAAWVAIVMPPYAGLVVHGAMFIACYAVDRRVYPAHGLGAWLTLRFRASLVASLSCFVGAAGS